MRNLTSDVRPSLGDGGKGFFSTCLVAGIVTLLLALVPTGIAAAGTDTVTTCAASGPGSLAAVVGSAAPGDTVTFSVSCPPGSPIALTAAVDLTVDLTIDGPGASSVAVTGGGSNGVFDVASGVTASISGLTLEDSTFGINNAGTLALSDATVSNNGSGFTGGIVNSGNLTVTASTLSDNIIGVGTGFGGGGIYNAGGMVTVNASTLSNNAAANGADGGGIYNHAGSLIITDSSLSGDNTGMGSGGAIYNDGGSLAISDSTLANNTAVDHNGGAIDNNAGTATVTDSTLFKNSAFYHAHGGGIYNHGSLIVTNSTLSGNGAKYSGSMGGNIYNDGTAAVAATIVAKGTAGGDCSGAITDGGYNVDDDGTCGFTAVTDVSDTPAGLDPRGLQQNGGPTKTIALESSSPAVGAVTNALLCSTPDQRGVARPTPCDIGAVELALPPQAITSSDSAPATVGSPFSFTVTTSGTPVPSITKKGKLPKHLKLVDQGNGTALISGTPTKAGVYHFTIKATFGQGMRGQSVDQPFTLTVGT